MMLWGLNGGLRLLLTLVLVECGSGGGGEVVDVEMWIMEGGVLGRGRGHGERRVVGGEMKRRRWKGLRIRFGPPEVFGHVNGAMNGPVRKV